MKISFTIILFILVAGTCFSQDKDYIIKNSGDTIYGEVTYWGYSFRKGTKFKIKTPTGEKFKLRPDEAKKVHYEDDDYVLKPVKPEKPKKSIDDFMNIVMSNGSSTVYRHRYQKTDANHIVHEIINYYLYDGDKFIDYLTRKNFEELIPTYFKDCDRLLREIEHNRRFKFKDLIRTYNNYCK